MSSSRPKLQPFRLRLWSKGEYAASFADPGVGHFTLVEGMPRYAHIIEVRGRTWVEITDSPLQFNRPPLFDN